MIEGRPSNTAFQVAAARAAHMRFDPKPPLLNDIHAEALLDAEGLEMIEGYADGGPWIMLENRFFLPLRARFVEDQLAKAYARGVRQFVILGAGLDSFAWRQPPGISELRLYEVDHPSTQSWKMNRLKELGWTTPNNTSLVPCDFEGQSTSEALARTDFDPTKPCVVSWMGVIYYLNRDTAESSLRDLAKLMAPTSELIFDSMLPWDMLPERYQIIRKAMAEYLNGAGEPQINRYEPTELVQAVEAAGFAKAEILHPADLVTRYLDPSQLTLEIPERFRLAVATR